LPGNLVASGRSAGRIWAATRHGPWLPGPGLGGSEKRCALDVASPSTTGISPHTVASPRSSFAAAVSSRGPKSGLRQPCLDAPASGAAFRCLGIRCIRMLYAVTRAASTCGARKPVATVNQLSGARVITPLAAHHGDATHPVRPENLKPFTELTLLAFLLTLGAGKEPCSCRAPHEHVKFPVTLSTRDRCRRDGGCRACYAT
jgi:hypothetical protein